MSDSNSKPWGLHWFRRDLRLAGNPALIKNVARFQGRVLGIFCFDSEFLARPDFSHNRFAFFMNTLAALREEMRKIGGDLLVLNEAPQRSFPSLFERLKRNGTQPPSIVSFNRDYEPFARRRDEKISLLLKKDFGCEVLIERDHLLIEPEELLKSDGGYYRIYTPFSKQWFERFKSEKIQARVRSAFEMPKKLVLNWRDVLGAAAVELDSLEAFNERNSAKVSVPIPNSGSEAARKCLAAFQSKVKDYSKLRDFPAERATSQLSIFLKNGSITVSQVISTLDLSPRGEAGQLQYFKELVWREFYYHILWNCPRVENESFIEKYKHIQWENKQEYFEAWKEGKTGYPMVDAGMRQLKATGWMHNRVRMVVASFLVKDLLIDWRWGEKYFMETLLDGDLAPNNGGWQWAASTGCDPQPYFRIFNPTLQSEKFDPEGSYIKRWCPELAKHSGKALHQPKAPIVDHASRKLKALSLYQSVQ